MRRAEMHYYKFNIKDWTRDTAHLTVTEEGIYRRLIDQYYESEMPIPLETQSVIRRLRLAGHEESVGLILDEFFVKESDGYRNPRCDQEIKAYHAKAEANRENGKNGGRPKKPTENPDGFQQEPTDNLNQEPPTTNQQPPTSKKTSAPSAKKSSSISAGEMIDSLPGLGLHTAEEYRGFRNAKKAPLTAGAWKTIAKEIGKSGMSPDDALNTAMARGWQGFDASWLQNRQSGFNGMGKQEAIEAHNQRVVEEIMRREQQRIGSAAQGDFDMGDAITIEGEVINAY